MAGPVAVWDMTIPAEGVEKDDLIVFFNEHFKKWIFQLEKGEQTGYLHYQFRGSLNVKLRKTGLMKLIRAEDSPFPKISERAVTPTVTDTVILTYERYTSKLETRVDGPWSSEDQANYIPIDMRFTPEWNELQQMIITRTQEPPNRRIINCIVDTKGNNGKSFLATWMYTHGQANYIPFFTEAKDLMRMVFGLPRRSVYFIDLPRALSHRAEHEIYGGIEQLKTGIIYDDRYRFKMEAIDPVHVFVFTNRAPNMELASMDRWRIHFMQNPEI